jgi:hypothetical protein
MVEENYTSYLLRLWKSEIEGRPAWRASLECTRTGTQTFFTLPGLLAFLQTQFCPEEEGQERPRETVDPRQS